MSCQGQGDLAAIRKQRLWCRGPACVAAETVARQTDKLFLVVCLLASLGIVACLAFGTRVSAASLNFGPEQLIQVGGSDLTVLGYSVPYYYDWDNDGRSDLIIGEGGGGWNGKVRVYPNIGTVSSPRFADYQYLQSLGTDLEVSASGCLGVFPRVMDYDADGRQDLLLGQANGEVKRYLNTGTDELPSLDEGQPLEIGPAGAEQPLDCGNRATLSVVDWDNDGLEDLVTGALDGRLRVYVNEGISGAPQFLSEMIVPGLDGDLRVPSDRSSPVVVDLDGDGAKDILTGNTNGEILLYGNQGTDNAPVFSDFDYVTSDDVKIDLPGTPRSRPFVTDWTGDGLMDLLVGSADGTVRLYEGITDTPDVVLQAGDANQDLRFDQLDLFQVLRSAKYLTGQPATWGEGDWDAAPGGSPGDPPAGDGLFDTRDVLAALRAETWLKGPYAATDSQLELDGIQGSVWWDEVAQEPSILNVSVPEPSARLLTVIGLISLLACVEQRRAEQRRRISCRRISCRTSIGRLPTATATTTPPATVVAFRSCLVHIDSTPNDPL